MTISMFIWRPILAGMVTLQELDTHWTLCDLMDAHEALDIQSEANAFYSKQNN
jgi:hypothetical protein